MKFELALSGLLASMTGNVVSGQSACAADTPFTVNGPCTFDNFENKTSCSLRLANITREAVEEACAAAAYPFQNISHLPYQFDKNFMDGDSQWNDSPTADLTIAEQARITNVQTNIASKERIGYPEYDALKPYMLKVVNNDESKLLPPLMDNFNTSDSCQDNTIMCCYTEQVNDNLSDLANAKICTHDMEDSDTSAHVERGFVTYNDGVDAYCVGYTWDDDTSKTYMGNALFDISFLTVTEKGVYKAAPGSPLCGCLDKMPTVTNADCRKVDVTTESHTFQLSATGTVEITDQASSFEVNDCGESLRDAAASDISDRIVGTSATSTCGDTSEKLLNNKFWIPGTIDDSPLLNDHGRWIDVDTTDNTTNWEIIAGKGKRFWPVDTSESGLEKLDVTFRANTSDSLVQWILRRYCDSCSYTHRDCYYRRYTALPKTYEAVNADGENVTETFNSIEMFLNYWHQEPFNVPSVDYNIFSSLEDAINDVNPWKAYPKKTSSTVGFPHDDGPRENGYYEWNSYNRGEVGDWLRNNGYDHAFYLPVEDLALGPVVTVTDEDRKRALLSKAEEEGKGDNKQESQVEENVDYEV